MTPGGLNEAEQIQQTPDHCDLEAVEAERTVKDVRRTRDQQCDLLPVEVEAWRHESRRHSAVA